MPVDILPLTDPELGYRLNSAAAQYDAPDIPYMGWDGFVNSFAIPSPGYREERFVARLDGVPAGVLEVQMPQLDNLETAEMELHVVPELRRHGVGRALYEHALGLVGANGRTRIFTESVDQRPDGAAFLDAMGASPGLVEVRSRLDVDEAWPRLADLLAGAQPHAEGYGLVQWVGVPPDDVIDDIAVLDSSFLAEAPSGDLEVEPEKVDAQRIREREELGVSRGSTRIHTAARHEASGRVVAWTMVAANAAPWHAWQGITLVDPAHRGHRLGLLIKIENLRYARGLRPDLRAIDTVNAESNDHMLAINRTLGFRALESWTQWQITLAGASEAR